MDLRDYLRVIRKRWAIISVATGLCLLAALAITALTPKTYEASATLFVSTSQANTTAELAQGSTFTQNQVKTYADVMTTPAVLDPVIKDLGLSQTSQELARSVTSSVPTDTSLLTVAVTDREPGFAAKVANAIASRFTTTVKELESVNNGSSPVKVTVVSEATTPTSPVNPRPARNLALGLVLGLLLGLGAALLREMFDTSVKADRDIAAVTDLPLIGTIHFDDAAKDAPLIAQADPHGIRAEAFRALRTNLQFIDAGNNPRVLVITSSLPGEGKTTTAANLALTIGASGARVCVIEGDLRRPKLLEYMGLEGSVGLTTVLIGEAELADVLQPIAPNVTGLGTGPIPPNPSELLGSPAMAALLATLREQFDYVIIDAPPLLPVTDAAVASTLADGVVLVVGSGIIKRENLSRALEILDAVGARTLGIVFNRIPVKGADASTYYGYSYTYGPEGPQASRRGSHRESREVASAGNRTTGSEAAQAASAAEVDRHAAV